MYQFHHRLSLIHAFFPQEIVLNGKKENLFVNLNILRNFTVLFHSEVWNYVSYSGNCRTVLDWEWKTFSGRFELKILRKLINSRVSPTMKAILSQRAIPLDISQALTDKFVQKL